MKKTVSVRMLMVFGCGLAAGMFLMSARQAQPLQASTAMGNDKFSMVTVPVNPLGDTETVFVLDHLSGILRGGYLNNQTATFTHHFIRNVGLDFNLDPRTPNPKYAIVSAPGNVTGRPQPANGIIYIGELTSGAVIAYGYVRPQGNSSAGPIEITKLSYFQFRESIGG